MGLLKWLFGKGDAVEYDDHGRVVRGTVKGFKPDGFVDVKVKGEQGDSKDVSKFGGNLRPTGKSK